MASASSSAATSRRLSPAGTRSVQLADAECLEGLARDAGFADVRVEEVHRCLVVPDVNK